jgi:DNA invertase Pin-like site-specific DNA recombinase
MRGDHPGDARVSTRSESLEHQFDALRAAGCARVWSGAGTGQHARSGLTEVPECLRPGDPLVVWSLDRIGRRTDAEQVDHHSRLQTPTRPSTAMSH